MIGHYFLPAWRSLLRERMYAAINVIGLAIGLTLCLLVFNYIKDEHSYDRFHQGLESLYRVNYVIPERDGGAERHAGTAFPLGDGLLTQIPEITQIVRVAEHTGGVVQYGPAVFREPFLFADSLFFELFTFPLLAGNPTTALDDPYSVVMTERLAAKYFGDEPPLGKQVSLEVRGKRHTYTVTGICRNVPGNSSIPFDMVVPLRRVYELYNDWKLEWNLTWASTYVRLQPGATPAVVEPKLRELAAGYPIDGSIPNAISLELQPLATLHHDPEVTDGQTPPGNITHIYILAGIAAIVLALACINFTTLAIGRSQMRVREIGIRKVLGADARRLLARLLGESAVFCVLAMLLALVLAELLLPTFNELAAKQIARTALLDIPTAIAALILMAVTTLVAGGYPAARHSPICRLGCPHCHRPCHVRPTPIHEPDSLGFDTEYLMGVSVSGTGDEKMRTIDLLRTSLVGHEGILSVSASGRSFDGTGMSNATYLPDSQLFSAYVNPVDEYFVKTMGLSVIQGDNFTGSRSSEVAEPALVNESLVRALHLINPIGDTVPGFGNIRIIGVVNDFHFLTLNHEIQPLIMPLVTKDSWGSEVRFAYLRLSPGKVAPVIDLLSQTWQKIAPDKPFDFWFLDEHIDAQYRFEQRWWKVVSLTSLLAILVACFGAFGLTALAVARRQKEIGVRKVLGAGVGQIVGLLNREFVLMLTGSILIAWPVAWIVTSRWLDTFAYRLSLSPWPFVLAAVLTLGIVILTVSVQAFRAARANPVEALRHE